MTVPPASATVPWFARPWVWVVVAGGATLARNLLPSTSLSDVTLRAVFWLGLVASVAATIAKARRWATRGTQVAAWVSGIGTLVGAVYAATRPEYDNGIGDAGLVLLVTVVHVGIAWGTQPPTR